MSLTLVAKALGLEAESPVEKVLDAVSTLQARAKEADEWEKEAHGNLEKLEKTDRLLKENAVLRVEGFMRKVSDDFGISKAEADEFTNQIVRGEMTEAAVKAVLAKRGKADYFTRKSSLDVKAAPGDPIAEVNGRAAELMAKDAKLSKAAAMIAVKESDKDLSERYDAVMLGRGGDR